MTPRAGTAPSFLLAAVFLAGCGSSQPGGPGPAGPGPTGGRGGASGGSGGSSGGVGAGTSGGSGGTMAAGSGGGGGAAGSTAGAGGSTGGSGASQGGSGGSTPPADAAPPDGEQPPPPPPPGGEPPLPACLKTTPVASGDQLAAAITGAEPGACLVLADGNYTFPIITKIGTEAAPIVIRAANRGKAVINAGAILFVKSAHVVVEGFDITTPGVATPMYNGGSNGAIVSFMDSHHCRLSRSRVHPAGPVAERDWVVVVGAESHHNRIDHNDLGPVNVNANMVVIDGTGRESPLTVGNVSQHNRIDHNHFHEVNNSGGNNWETLRIGRSWQGPTKGFTVIEHNLLVRTTGDPETISLKSSDNIVRYNTMLNVNGEITSRHGNRNQIYGNYIIGGSRGMRIYGADHRIYNNYVAASSTGIWIESGAAAAMDEPGAEHYRVYRAWVFNNTVIGQPIRLGGSKAFQPLDCRVANNVVVGAGIDNGGMGTISEGNIAGGTSPLTMQDGIHRLLPNAAGAAAIGKAVNSDFYMIKEDIQGQPRVAPDVGADEQSDAPITFKGPLTTADVGPDAP
jgi:poly(beta-D-mannuronate) lyase